MLFIGHTRFSLFVPGSSAWHASKGGRFKTPSDYRDFLFSDKRLNLRTEIFLDESLPQIAMAIGNHEVQHVVSYSDSLPTKYQQALEDAAKHYDFVVLDMHTGANSTNPPAAVARRAVSLLDPEDGVFGRYRLDDDDLLPTTYFDQMAPYLTHDHVGWLISLGAGFTGVRIGHNYYNIRKAYSPMLAIGLLSVCKVERSGAITSPRSASHTQADRVNPVILDSRSPGYFWGRHPHQDTDLRPSASNSPEVAIAALNRLHSSISHFPAATDDDDLDRLFPVIWDKMRVGLTAVSEDADLLDDEIVLRASPHSFAWQTNGGLLGVSGTLVIEGNPKTYNALLSFNLIRSDGSPLSGDDELKLHEADITKSPNESIGYYRYIPTFRGRRDFHFTFDIPDNIVCTSVSIRKFGNMKCAMRLKKFVLYAPRNI